MSCLSPAFNGAAGKQKKKKTACSDSSPGTISARQKAALVKLFAERAKRRKKRAALDSSFRPPPSCVRQTYPEEEIFSESFFYRCLFQEVCFGRASIKPSTKKKSSSSDAASSVKPSGKKRVCVDCSSSSLTTPTKSVLVQALGETSPPSASSSVAAAHSNDMAVAASSTLKRSLAVGDDGPLTKKTAVHDSCSVPNNSSGTALLIPVRGDSSTILDNRSFISTNVGNLGNSETKTLTATTKRNRPNTQEQNTQKIQNTLHPIKPRQTHRRPPISR